MNIDDAFPSKFLKASDLQGRSVSATIRDCTIEKMGDDTKPVLWFSGKEKGLTLNVTKTKILKEAFGKDTLQWVGRSIGMRPGKTMYAGNLVDCIDIHPLQLQAQVPAQAPPPPVSQPQWPAQQPVQYRAPEPVSDFIDDDVPF